jgi:hypothetical protein
MDFGLLWYDGDPRRPLEEKIERAARRYREKFGRRPNTCFVHPQLVHERSGKKKHVADPPATIRVVSAPTVLLHHFWVGVCTKNGSVKTSKTES